MPLLLNGAGALAADPILKGLGVETGASSTTMNLATVDDAGLDQAAGFPATNSVLGALSPAATVTTRGNNASYDDTTKLVNIGSTTGLTPGDLVYLSHASITDGRFRIATLDADGLSITLENNPFDGGGPKAGIAYQVAWRYVFTAGTAPSASSAAGSVNYWKFNGADDAANATTEEDLFYIADAPTGAAFVSIDGKPYDGSGTTNDPTPTFDLLPGWTSKGGTSYLAFGAHSVQAINNFSFADGTTAEKDLATALAGGLQLSAGDGVKYGRLLLRSLSGAVIERAVDIAITLDTTGPQITLFLNGA